MEGRRDTREGRRLATAPGRQILSCLLGWALASGHWACSQALWPVIASEASKENPIAAAELLCVAVQACTGVCIFFLFLCDSIFHSFKVQQGVNYNPQSSDYRHMMGHNATHPT